MVKNRVLFPITNQLYQLFAPQVPADTFEQFEGQWALRVIPTPEDLSTTQATDLFGNLVIAGYAVRDSLHTYQFDLKYNLYGFYKILQKIQQEAISGGAPQQVEMVDFIDPNPEDTQPNQQGEILGYTRRFGAIAELELIGSTNYALTQNFANPPGEYLKTYRCQGTRFIFEERGVPTKLTLTAPGGTLDLFPLRDEYEQNYEGEETFTDGFSQTFVEAGRKRSVISVNMAVNDAAIVAQLLTLQASCITPGTNVFNPATLTYNGQTISGAIQQIRAPGAIYSRFNKTTQSQDETNGGFSFRFTEL